MGKSRHILQSLHRQWVVQGLIFCGLLSVPAGILLRMILGPPWSGVLLSGAFFCISLFIFPFWRISIGDTARILNRSLPELEESCGLLLKPVEELGALERLQVDRIGLRLSRLGLPNPLRKKLIIGVCVLAAVGLVRILVRPDGTATKVVVREAPKPVAPVIPGVQTVKIRITPPAYTGRIVHEQQSFNLRVEEGSMMSWELQTNVAVDSLQFIFNDTAHIALKPADVHHMIWRSSSLARNSGFYQLKVGDKLSDLYKVEVVKDEAPRISIRTPKAYTIVDFGESRKIPLGVKIQDDYGISAATVIATIATGSGEAVKFKEQTLPFGVAFSGSQPVYDLQQTLNLDALGLHPGDELYFYCKAKDNHGQETRSDMYIITLPDTAKLMSLEGLTTGVDVKPEFFRSERQIIIETEQLLKSKDTISVDAFNDKCNSLGVDQKLLRLRYGKFLGEEAEEGGAEESFKAAGTSPADFSNAAKVLDAFTDKHDNAKDATYFEPAIKAQLKATLTEMWNAELRLRTYKASEALPYEYKALRLLKDLQQKSRAYVAKTGVKVTPLDLAKRLTGKLDDIGEPKEIYTAAQEPSAEEKLRMALSILEQPVMLSGGPSVAILQDASRQLGKQAVAHPGEYLSGFQAMRRILGGGNGADARSAQQAIRKMLSVPEANPSVMRAAPDKGLSQLYFNNVNKQ